MKRLVVLMLLVNNFLVAYNQIIKGIVLDKETRDIIAGAAVYFNGTFAGTYSDKNGNFQLDVSKNTSMPLSIRALGYNSVTINSFSTTESLIIYLTPKIFNLNEVVVSDRSLARERKLNIKLFKDVFLGTTSNASRCKIINENDITFNYKTDKDTLKAFALKPLKIENRALGYRITYFLDNFEYDRKNKTFFFKGNLIFNEEMPTEETHKQSYEQQRINSYKGS
ncbi:MAG: carboxypeptidase-like regulatory domain-containing protein, partial [Bacteroidia bacterium]|nr:carboxypeptidase-like regulatory domain-containing protein [Bacteroidia bacterium]